MFSSCNSLNEEEVKLEGDFYIQDGWLAFLSENYKEANNYFDIAIETNISGSLYHFKSYIGKGWSYLYNAKTKYILTWRKKYPPSLLVSRETFF